MALAAVAQVASLVQQAARGQIEDSNGVEAIIGAIVITDAEHVDHIYGSKVNLKVGYKTICAQLSGTPTHKDAEITRYIAGILQLERKLSRQSSRFEELGKRIEQLKRQVSLYELMSSQMLSNIASVYSDLISPMGPKLQISGNPVLLKQPAVQDKIRALLLGGIRAAVLWRQLGGRRRHILFSRKPILQNAKSVLRQIENSY